MLYIQYMTLSVQPVGSLTTPVAAVLSPVNTPNGIIEFTKGVTYHDSQHHREHEYCRIKHQGQNDPCRYFSSQVQGWTQDGAGDYLEINLGYPRLMTHIGTTGKTLQSLHATYYTFADACISNLACLLCSGEYPATKIFPTRQIVGRRRLRRFREEGENEEYLMADRGMNIVQINVQIIVHMAVRWILTDTYESVSLFR